jgi:hypothetical protein
MRVGLFTVNMSSKAYVTRNWEYFFIFNGVMHSLPIRHDDVTVRRGEKAR